MSFGLGLCKDTLPFLTRLQKTEASLIAQLVKKSA